MQITGKSFDGKSKRLLAVTPADDPACFEVLVASPGKVASGHRMLIEKTDLLRIFMWMLVDAIHLKPETIASWLLTQINRGPETAAQDVRCPVCKSVRGYGSDSASEETFERCLDCGAPRSPEQLVKEVAGRVIRMRGG